MPPYGNVWVQSRSPVVGSNVEIAPESSPMTRSPELTSGVVGAPPTEAVQTTVPFPPPRSRSVRLIANTFPRTSATKTSAPAATGPAWIGNWEGQYMLPRLGGEGAAERRESGPVRRASRAHPSPDRVVPEGGGEGGGRRPVWDRVRAPAGPRPARDQEGRHGDQGERRNDEATGTARPGRPAPDTGRGAPRRIYTCRTTPLSGGTLK